MLATALGVHLTTAFVYQVLPPYLVSRGLPRASLATAMTLGQWPEIVALAVLPRLTLRFGVKATMAAGLAAYVVRFGSLAFDPPLWVAVAGITLHGVGYACFSVAAQVSIDAEAPPALRASTQALFAVVTSGLGVLLGSLLAGDVARAFPEGLATAFVVPAVIDLVLLAYFCVGYPRRPAAAGPWT